MPAVEDRDGQQVEDAEVDADERREQQYGGKALFGLLAARFLFAFLAMGALALAGVVKVDYRGKPLAKLLGISLLYPGLYFFSEAMSLTQVSSAIVGVVIGIAPITTPEADLNTLLS